MKEETVVAIGLGCIAVLLMIGIPYCMSLDDEVINVEGKIIDVEIIEKVKKGLNVYYDRVRLTFDNGDSYIVRLDDYETDVYDFTVNSKFIVKLFRNDVDSDWELKKIYKIPE